PGGALGKKLLLSVADVMLSHDLPTLRPERPMRECVVLLAEKRGTVAVVDERGSLLGVVTAGDLTRLMERAEAFLDIPVGEVMTRTPKTTTPDELAGAAVQVMERHGIMALPVLDGGRRVVGMVHLHDLMRAGGRANWPITLSEPRGAETSPPTAKEGTYRWRTGNMEARGSVLVVRTDGATLRTEVLRYFQAKNEVSSDKRFVFDEPNRHVE